MFAIKIKLLGEVAYENLIKLEAGYRCDVPTDELGIPFLPIAEMLETSGLFSAIPGIMVGFARPDGYPGLLREAGRLVRWFPKGNSRIREIFTREHFYPDKGYRIRSLRKGLLFYAPIDISKDEISKADQFVQGITRIGVQEEGVSGEVDCRICVIENLIHEGDPLSDLLTYSSLEYSITLLSPTCINAPFEEECSTFKYIPGAEVRKAMLFPEQDEFLKENLPGMQFSNAYISEGKTRLLPIPLCMSVIKLDREQLRYRLAEGKDPSRIEQDMILEDAFSSGFEDHFIEYVKPVVERMAGKDGHSYYGLTEGQVFRGTIYGTDEQIRKAARWIGQHPYMRIGELKQEGYGEVYITVDNLKEDPISAPILSTSFDVSCVSHTVLINEEGMSSCRAEDFLKEIECRLGLTGRLKFTGMYLDAYSDFSDRFEWSGESPVIRCLKMGSVFRVRTKDGSAVDISGIHHTFIGEYTLDGYGEIMAWPALGGYYRITKQKEPRRYDTDYPVSSRSLQIGAQLIRDMLRNLLKDRIRGLALTDTRKSTDVQSDERYIPVEVLEELRDIYDPQTSVETLKKWYIMALDKEDAVYAGSEL